MFLSRLRRKVTYQELGYQYGCGKESARRYCKELTNLFHEHFVPRLVFPRPPEELINMTLIEALILRLPLSCAQSFRIQSRRERIIGPDGIATKKSTYTPFV